MSTTPASEKWYRVSIDDITSEAGDFARLNGEYFLTGIGDAPPGVERWEVSFPTMSGYEQLRLEFTAGAKGRGRTARLFFVGSAASPVWSQQNIPNGSMLLHLNLERPAGALAMVKWPAIVPAELLVPPPASPSRKLLARPAAAKSHAISAIPIAAGGSSGTPPTSWPPSQPPCNDGSGDCMTGECCDKMMPPQAPPCNGGATEYPVKYFNGELQIAETDLATSGFGRAWGHTRTFSNQLASTYNFGNGYNWVVSQWPYLSVAGGGLIAATRGTDWIVWFQQQPDGSYAAQYGAKQTLTHTGSVFQLALTTGEVFEFNDFTQTSYPPGSFKSVTIAGGDTIDVTAYDPSGQIGEVQRNMTVDGQTVTESFLYTYVDSGNNAGNLAAVTLRRSTAGGPWSYIVRATYNYYDLNDPSGSLGDLRTATRQVPSGTGWADTTTSYYRYYVAGPQTHLLKYVVGPSGWATLTAAGNPLLAADAQVAQVATQYLEYDSTRRVTLETVAGGTQTTTLAYAASGYTANTDYNAWSHRTTEIQPDGSQYVVYTNYIGQVLVKDLQSGGKHWTEFRQYDANAREVLRASPSAVVGYSEGSPPGTLNVNLQAASGLFNLTAYYPDNDPAAGYVQSKSIRQGTGGTPVVQSAFTYTSQTVGPATVQMLASQTMYANDDGSGAITTSYAYTWYAGTLQVQQKTTTLPAVPLDQNGFNTADTQLEYYDAFGQMTWEQGPRWFIDSFTYDSVTGGTLQMIEDVDPSQMPLPAGWSRSSGLPAPLNLVTDYEIDNRGRRTQSLGPVHLVDGVGVRTATWTVYDDVKFTTATAQGYATGSAPNYVYNSIGPISIQITNESGQPTDAIQASVGGPSRGPLPWYAGGPSQGPLPSYAPPQSTWTRWTKTLYDDAGRLIATRAYYAIPASGDGTPEANYNETGYGYDIMGRQNRVVTPGGTINRTTYDVRGNITGTYVGTSDYGATDSDPTGGGAGGNNMVIVTANQYDGGSGSGDSDLTQTTAYVDDTTTRVTQYGYDWRDRQVTITGELSHFRQNTYDNLNHVVQVDTYDGSASGTLLTRKQALYDTRGNVYRTIMYGVDPSTGTVGNSLVSNTWYDAAGNPIKQLPAGSQLFTKTVYDSQARVVAEYAGYYTGSGSEPIADVSLITTSNKIFEQTLTTFDAAGNPIEVDSYQRNHNATGGGPLNATYTGTQPLARTTYMAGYFDGVGEQTALANYGTNGGAQFIRPDSVPASADTVLVTTFAYDPAGNQFQTIDSAGSITRQMFDALSRVTSTVSNDTGACPGNDHDVTVEFAYNADGNLLSLTAVNPTTGNQVTRYQYGATLADSAIASNLLLSATIYPDATDPADRVTQTYNRQSQVTGMTDQNGTVHEYLYDLLGRQTDDVVTTLGPNIDGSVRRIGQAYDERGLLYQVTSYADADGTTVVNEIQNEYDDFQQLTTQFQEHGGAVNVSASPQVDYSYADGSANTVRPTALAYPNGRVISYGYGTSDGDALSRIATYLDVASGITLVNYTYLGLNSFVQVNYPQPSITYNLANGSGNDPYSGLDQFDRVIDSLWQGPTSTLAEIQYGYNRASSRIWRKDPAASSQSPPVYQDELYSYDGLQRLIDMSRGQLISGNTQITNLALAQQWGLDATGNWSTFVNTDTTNPANSLDQQRVSNAVNEIAAISQRYGAAWAQPAYDRAGNMTTIPQPSTPTASFSATYDAWNRIVSLTGTASYAYDGVNRRTSSTASDVVRDYYYSTDWQILEERVEGGISVAKEANSRRSLVTAGAAERQFIWGRRYVDDLVLRDRSTTGALNERLYAVQDANWRVVAICSSSGSVLERYEYFGYGNPAFLDAAFLPAPFGGNYEWETLYDGFRWDHLTGLYSVRFRYLNSALGIWNSRDSLYWMPNQYEFAWSNPLYYIDSNGQFALVLSFPVVIIIVIITIIGIGVTGVLSPPRPIHIPRMKMPTWPRRNPGPKPKTPIDFPPPIRFGGRNCVLIGSGGCNRNTCKKRCTYSCNGGPAEDYPIPCGPGNWDPPCPWTITV